MRSAKERQLEIRNPRAARVDFLIRKAALSARAGDPRKALWAPAGGGGSGGSFGGGTGGGDDQQSR